MQRAAVRAKDRQIDPGKIGPKAGAPHHIGDVQDTPVEGRMIARWFLQVDTQPEVGEETYDEGAKILQTFFHRCLADFQDPDLEPLGKQIITCCLDGGGLEDYEQLIPAG